MNRSWWAGEVLVHIEVCEGSKNKEKPHSFISTARGWTQNRGGN